MKSYRDYFTNKAYLESFSLGVFFLASSLYIQSFASNYATRVSTNSVSDIILSNIPAFDVDMIFVWGSVIVTFIVLFICLHKVKYFPFLMKSVALFTVIRSIFVSLTHISAFHDHIAIDSVLAKEALFNGIFTGNDLFFSGHTGLPFLLALMFWSNKPLRFFFLFCSLSFATVVLLGHMHYSIDVFGAYFITYSIFHICEKFFKKDRQLFLSQ